MNTNYASFGKRLGAYVIDMILLTIIQMILSSLLIGSAIGAASDPDSLEALPAGIGLVMGITLLIFVLYFAYFESSAKQGTFGKQIMKIKVTNSNGERISFVHALGRTLAKFISSMILMIGFIMAAFTSKKQGLHDMIASTLVLNSGETKSLDKDLV